ncbi:DUF2231 domain-containing protein [Aggregatilinea lenta]|uniref:DUF2231 domain-containing protein n=1 Tax=Aggregatilinea lenta TaxID=913108 RepID=UPI0013C36608|nr:DUF2231 domain-containing protein [Aggregatilinea lenta]
MTRTAVSIQDELDRAMKKIPLLSTAANGVKSTLHGLVMAGGQPVRRVADVLHGTWLGHPLHPVLTDITIGAWTLAPLFDLLGLMGRSKGARETGDRLVALGTASAAATAVTGWADFSTIPNPAARTGLVHGVLNVCALVLNVLSMGARRKGNHVGGTLTSMFALSVATLSAYLGGDLVFRHKVGVNHAPAHRGKPEDWTRVLPEGELIEHTPIRIEVEDVPVLLYRYGGMVYALGATCSHAGGPLEQGMFDGTCVECPWHQSVFDLRDGAVVHGPATYQQPTYQTRIEDGQIELRAVPAG